jgi:excisionase family DNA binding protein
MSNPASSLIRVVHVADCAQDVEQPPAMFADFPDVMSTSQAAKALGCSETWLRQAAARGAVRSFHVGRNIKISRVALLEFIEKGGAA